VPVFSQRLSERRAEMDSRIVGWLVGLFAAMQWLSIGRRVLIEFGGDWIDNVATFAGSVSILPLVAATAWMLHRQGSPLRLSAWTWIVCVAAIVAAATGVGFVHGLTPKQILYDSFSFTAILCFVILGANPAAFKSVGNVWFFVLLAGIALNIAGFSDLSLFSVDLKSGARIARETMSYRTQQTLSAIILCNAFAFDWARWRRWIVAAGWALIIFQQVIYKKRLVTVFYMALFGVLTWLVVRDSARTDRQRCKRALEIAMVVGALAMVGVIVGGRFILPQAQSLVARLSGQSEDVQYTSGALDYMMRNERFAIVVDSLSGLSPLELAVGRGMGGGVPLAEGYQLLDTPNADEFWDSYYLADYGFFGRRGFEVGMAVPILKGGLVLWVAFYFGYFLFFAQARQMKRTLTGRICMVTVGAHLGYTVFGGDFTLSVIFQSAGIATCLGYGLSRYVSHGARVAPLRPQLRLAAVAALDRGVVVSPPRVSRQ
jgi:hypothetical protein